MLSIDQTWQQAQAAFATQRWVTARELLEKILTERPNSPSVLILLSYVHSYLGSYCVARDAALRAAALRPDSADTSADIASRLRTFNAGHQMVEYVGRLGSPSRLPIPLLLQCAAQFSYLNLQHEAHRYLQESLRADPLYPPTLVANAQVLMYLGRGDEAQVMLRKALARAPQIPEIYGLAGQMAKQIKDRTPFITQAERLLAEAALPDVQRAKVTFALHHLQDSEKKYEVATRMLEEGARLKRRGLKYSSEEAEKMFSALKSLPTKRTTAIRASERAMPIFIVGMHRSGTTLLEQLVTANRHVHGIGELYDFTGAMRAATDYHCRGVMDLTLVEKVLAHPPSFADVGSSYLESVSWRLRGQSIFTDKLPSNFLNVGFIAQALPGAKILHMVRDPIETCFSNLRELFSDANPYSYDQLELAKYYAMYADLMRHWHAQFPDQILQVEYKRLTTDTHAVMKDVANFCGIEFVDSMTDPGSSDRAVATASAVQVREGIRAREVPKWKPYEKFLQPMITRLDEDGMLNSGG